MSATVTRVVIADDQPLVRTGLSALIDAEPDLHVVAAVGDGAAAIAAARTHHADVVCLDIRMPGTDGISATTELAGPQAAEPIPVLIITTFDVDDYLFGALEAGASGFLLKDAEATTIVEAVRSVAHGHGTLDSALTRRVLSEVVARRRTQPIVGPRASSLLTPRESDILLLLARGLSNDDIARELVLEVSTVKSHLARMMPKIGVKSRLQAVVWAYQNDLVRPGA